jgi:hypothetical protein
MLLEPAILRYSAQGMPYFNVDTQNFSLTGIKALHIEVQAQAGLLVWRTEWADDATAEGRLSVKTAELVDAADLALILAFQEDNGG